MTLLCLGIVLQGGYHNQQHFTDEEMTQKGSMTDQGPTVSKY